MRHLRHLRHLRHPRRLRHLLKQSYRLWHLRHWLQCLQFRTRNHDNLCYRTIKCDTGQHLQFLQCFTIVAIVLLFYYCSTIHGTPSQKGTVKILRPQRLFCAYSPRKMSMPNQNYTAITAENLVCTPCSKMASGNSCDLDFYIVYIVYIFYIYSIYILWWAHHLCPSLAIQEATGRRERRRSDVCKQNNHEKGVE